MSPTTGRTAACTRIDTEPIHVCDPLAPTPAAGPGAPCALASPNLERPRRVTARSLVFLSRLVARDRLARRCAHRDQASGDGRGGHGADAWSDLHTQSGVSAPLALRPGSGDRGDPRRTVQRGGRRACAWPLLCGKQKLGRLAGAGASRCFPMVRGRGRSRCVMDRGMGGLRQRPIHETTSPPGGARRISLCLHDSHPGLRGCGSVAVRR